MSATHLILWRHAEAEDDGSDDLARKLTAKGRKQAARMAQWLHAQLPESALLLVSPAVRARQTAQALAELGNRKLKISAALAPGSAAREMLEAVEWPRRKGALVLVGHQPALGHLAALLLSGREAEWSIRKGAVWWFAARNGDGGSDIALRAVLAPDQL